MSFQSIAIAIKKARESAGISQQQLAIALEYRFQRFHGENKGYSQQTISNWERLGNIGAMELLELCQITGKAICIGGTLVSPTNRLNSKVLWIIALSYWIYLATLDEELS